MTADIPTHRGKPIPQIGPNSEANTDDRYMPPLTLEQQYRYALAYAIKADQAVERAKSLEAYNATIQAAERAWAKVEQIKEKIERKDA